MLLFFTYTRTIFKARQTKNISLFNARDVEIEPTVEIEPAVLIEEGGKALSQPRNIQFLFFRATHFDDYTIYKKNYFRHEFEVVKEEVLSDHFPMKLNSVTLQYRFQ